MKVILLISLFTSGILAQSIYFSNEYNVSIKASSDENSGEVRVSLPKVKAIGRHDSSKLEVFTFVNWTRMSVKHEAKIVSYVCYDKKLIIFKNFNQSLKKENAMNSSNLASGRPLNELFLAQTRWLFKRVRGLNKKNMITKVCSTEVLTNSFVNRNNVMNFVGSKISIGNGYHVVVKKDELIVNWDN